MARCLCLLVSTVCLFVSSAYSGVPPRGIFTDKRYNITFKAVVDVLWKGFSAEIQNRSNVLLFTMPSATDIVFIDQVLDKETKERVHKSLPLYERFHKDLITADGWVRNGEIRFKTIFNADLKLEDMNNGILIGYAYNKLYVSSDRFQLTVNDMNDHYSKWYGLYSKVTGSGMGDTCKVMHCAYPEVLRQNAPFAIITLATWKITSITGFKWFDEVKFALSETSSTMVAVARSAAEYDYAEFKYPTREECTGRVLRLPYQSNFNLTFVIPTTEKKCSSSEELWKNVRNVNLNGLKYKRQVMDVIIPLFRVAAHIDWKAKLKGTALAQAFDDQSSRLYKALAFQAAEVIFNPQVHKNEPLSALREDTPSFYADRPFFLALFHEKSPEPIFAGLINNPGCIKECLPMIIYH